MKPKTGIYRGIASITIDLMEHDHDVADRILRALRFRPRGMTITEVARQTNITRNSVSKHLEVLRIAGQVDMRSVGNAKLYSLAQRIPLSAFLCFTQNLIVVLDWYGTIVQINDHMLSLTGMKKEEVIGENIRDVPIPVLSVEERIRLIESVEHEPYVTDVHHMQNEDESFYQMQVIPTVFEDGERGRTIVLEDITEKRRYIRNMEFLAKTAMEFVDFPEDVDLYERIAEMVHEFVPDGRIFIQSYDEVRNQFTIRAVADADCRNSLTSLIGCDPVGMTFPLDEVLLSPFLENPQEIERGIREMLLSEGDGDEKVSLFDLTFRRIPKDVCEEITSTLNIGKAYMAFLVWNGRLLGDVGVFLSQHGEIQDLSALESFIRQASIVISRQMTEERLSRSNERFREVVEHAPFPTAIIGADGRFSYINHSFTQLFGYTMEDLKAGTEWLNTAFPDQDVRRKARDLCLSDCTHAGVNQIRSRMVPVRCRNGEMKRIIIRAQLLCDNTHYLAIEDTTELRRTHNVLLSALFSLKRRSEELRVKDRALSSLGCAVAITDADGYITYVNPAFLTLWGFGSADEVSGRESVELWVHSATVGKQRSFRSNQVWSGVMTGFRKDGTVIQIYGMLSPVRDTDGTVVGMTGSFIKEIPAERDVYGCISPG